MSKLNNISSVPKLSESAANALPVQEAVLEFDKESLQRMPIQRKLTIGSPDDPFEHEADAVADKIMRMPEHSFVQRKCAECEEEEEKLQRKPLASPVTEFIQSKGLGGVTAGDRISQKIDSTRGTGSSIDSGTKSFMESRFGADFSSVRIYTDSNAVQLSSEINAQAFTYGNNIYFNEGKFNTSSDSGKHLLAHELAHVVQQQKSQGTLQRQPAGRGTRLPPLPDKLIKLNDQIRIIGEVGLPYEIWRRLENVGLTKSEENTMLFKRKLEAIDKLGDLRDESAVPTLVAVLKDSIFGVQRLEPQQKLTLQRTAAESLGKIGGKVALSKLSDLLKSKDPQERKMAAQALPGVAGGQAATDLLTALQAETDADLKFQIIFALGNAAIYVVNMKERQAIAAELIRQMEKDKDIVRLAAVKALGKLRLKSATEPLLKLLASEHDVESLAAKIVNALGEIGDERAVDLVVILLRVHVKKRVRIEAALALGKIGGSKARAALKDRLKLEADADVKAAIFKAMTPVIHQTFRSAEESLP